jgi:hypothetical protein
MAKSSDDVVAEAMKILGKDAKVPTVDKFVQKPSSDRAQAGTDFTKNVNDLNTSLVAYQNACSSLVNGVEAYINIIAKEDFGLDSKKKDDVKKIAQAKKILTGFYTEAKKGIEGDVKSLDGFDKNLAAFTKFKPTLFW